MTTLTARQIGRAAYGAGFRGDALVTAIAVAIAESSGRVEVVNSIGCVGLWQINQPVHVHSHPSWTQGWLQNANNNAAAAYALSRSGWGPWEAYTNGSYRKYLTAARDGAQYAASAGSSGSGVTFGWENKAGNKGKTKPELPPKPKPPKVVDDPDPRARLGRVFLHGGKLQSTVTEAVTDASLDWSTTEMTQLSLTIADPGFELFRTGLFTKGTSVLYREPKDGKYPGFDLELKISSLTLDGGPAGTGGMSVKCRSAGVIKLRNRRGPKVMKKVSPTDFVLAECKAVGMKVVAQKSARRGHVARDVPAKGEEEMQGNEVPSSWSTFQRLAQELGFVCFEFCGTVYFGKPTWLIKQDKTPLQVSLPLPGAPEAWMSRTMPQISMSDDSDVPVEISGIEVERSRLVECRPGGAVQLRGLPPFNLLYLTTSMSMPLLGTGGITLSCSTPQNPPPQPPQKAAASGGGKNYDDTPDDGSSSATQTGSKSASTFVTIAITASSASYVFGAEASVSDATPSALDCSELVQWALGRMGITFTDGSSAQYAASHHISVEQAFHTRGALLHKEGHIGISMGDGTRTVEARNPSDGVGIFNGREIAWTGGGLVPGLKYG